MPTLAVLVGDTAQNIPGGALDRRYLDDLFHDLSADAVGVIRNAAEEMREDEIGGRRDPLLHPGIASRKSIDQQTARASGNTKGPAVLGEQLSASLREALVGQISEIKTGDEAATWAHRNLAAKNELRSGDELAWWETLNIDPVPVALRLWQETRADGVVPKDPRP